MGTPHRGADVANWGSIIAGIAKAMFLSPKKELLNDLKANSKTLSEISDDFVRIVSRYQIKSFYEENLLGGLTIVRPLLSSLPSMYPGGGLTMSAQIVNKDSATMKIPQEEAIPIHGDHRQICWFSSLEDDRFEAVWKAISRLIPEEHRGKHLAMLCIFSLFHQLTDGPFMV
jgi:hypothetical protein